MVRRAKTRPNDAMKTKPIKSITAEETKHVELPLSKEQIRKLVAITLGVGAELDNYSEAEVLGQGRAVFNALYDQGDPEAVEIAQEIYQGV